jgi:hypothetical protein
MEQIKAVESTSTKTISKIDTDRSNASQGEYIEKSFRIDNGERTFENSTSTTISLRCDGFGCNREAKIELTVKAGYLGAINLNLCENCRPKFKKSIIEEKQQATSPFWNDQDQRSSKYLAGKEVKEN